MHLSHRRRRNPVIQALTAVAFAVCLCLGTVWKGGTGPVPPTPAPSAGGIPCVSASGTRVSCAPPAAPRVGAGSLALLVFAGVATTGLLGAAAWSMARGAGAAGPDDG